MMRFLGFFRAIEIISWNDAQWEPVTGCSKASEGCRNCFAEDYAIGLQKKGNSLYKNGFQVTLQYTLLNEPATWKTPKKPVIVCPLSDLFHKDVPDAYIQKVFEVMAREDHHLYILLTRWLQRLLEISPYLLWTDGIWVGVTVENEKNTFRIEHLRQTHACHKYLHMEPLRGPVNYINLQGVEWVIIGGECAENARPLKEEWAKDIRNQVKAAGLPFFYKQQGGIDLETQVSELDGKKWVELPPNIYYARKKRLFF